MSEPGLFDVAPYHAPPAPEPPDGLGHDARRTWRQRQLIAAGVHPATGYQIIDGFSCGSCAHLWRKQSNTFAGWKCAIATANSSNDGPDVRKSWPACTAYTPREDQP